MFIYCNHSCTQNSIEFVCFEAPLKLESAFMSCVSTGETTRPNCKYNCDVWAIDSFSFSASFQHWQRTLMCFNIQPKIQILCQMVTFQYAYKHIRLIESTHLLAYTLSNQPDGDRKGILHWCCQQNPTVILSYSSHTTYSITKPV